MYMVLVMLVLFVGQRLKVGVFHMWNEKVGKEHVMLTVTLRAS